MEGSHPNGMKAFRVSVTLNAGKTIGTFKKAMIGDAAPTQMQEIIQC